MTYVFADAVVVVVTLRPTSFSADVTVDTEIERLRICTRTSERVRTIASRAGYDLLSGMGFALLAIRRLEGAGGASRAFSAISNLESEIKAANEDLRMTGCRQTIFAGAAVRGRCLCEVDRTKVVSANGGPMVKLMLTAQKCMESEAALLVDESVLIGQSEPC